MPTPRDLVGMQISGGLGNQLFSYASGLALATRLGGDLRFDTRAFRVSQFRQFQLPAFGLDLPSWSPTWWKIERFIRARSKGRWKPGPERLIEQRPLEPSFFTIEAPCYLKGFFQNWRYFDPVTAELRRRFDTTPLSTPRIKPIEDRIRSCRRSVMVHVRRGDYSPKMLIHAPYYEVAKATVHGEDATYFLFSDDMAEAMSMLGHWSNVVPVTGLTALEDFRLMSLCRHFITANSTFSWWTAWLGLAPDKIVVSPSTWFPRDGEEDRAARLPPSWVPV
jgi:Glycosyl transferase family 11